MSKDKSEYVSALTNLLSQLKNSTLGCEFIYTDSQIQALGDSAREIVGVEPIQTELLPPDAFKIPRPKPLLMLNVDSGTATAIHNAMAQRRAKKFLSGQRTITNYYDGFREPIDEQEYELIPSPLPEHQRLRRVTTTAPDGKVTNFYFPEELVGKRWARSVAGDEEKQLLHAHLLATLELWLQDAQVMLVDLDTASSSTSKDHPARYEQDAYLSWEKATHENPWLSERKLKEVHQWISDNGIELDGKSYKLPDFRTWSKYRRSALQRAGRS